MRRFAPDEIQRLTSGDVAERFRIAQKGAIAVGKDADFTLVELERRRSRYAENRSTTATSRARTSVAPSAVASAAHFCADKRFSRMVALPTGRPARFVRPDPV